MGSVHLRCARVSCTSSTRSALSNTHLTRLPYRLAAAVAKIPLWISPHLRPATLSIWHQPIAKGEGGGAGRNRKEALPRSSLGLIQSRSQEQPESDLSQAPLLPHRWCKPPLALGYPWPPVLPPGTDRSFPRHKYYLATHLFGNCQYLTRPESAPNPCLQITTF